MFLFSPIGSFYEVYSVNLIPNNLNTFDNLIQFIPSLSIDWPEFLSIDGFVHDHMESKTVQSIRDPISEGTGKDKVAPNDTEALMTLEIKRSHYTIAQNRQTYGLLALLGDVGGF